MDVVSTPGPLALPVRRAQDVIFIQHEPRVHGAQLRIDVEACGARTKVVKSWTKCPTFFDSFNPAGPVVVLGGTFDAYADDIAPWLPSLRKWLARAIRSHHPVFGICLGHQLMATSLGGRVNVGDSRGLEKSITRLTWIGTDPFVDAIAAPPLVFEDHADAVVELPEGARVLAHSARYIQAMRIENAVSVQFHPEVNRNLIEEWYRDDEPTQLPLYQHDYIAHETQLRHLSRRIARWIVQQT